MLVAWLVSPFPVCPAFASKKHHDTMTLHRLLRPNGLVKFTTAGLLCLTAYNTTRPVYLDDATTRRPFTASNTLAEDYHDSDVKRTAEIVSENIRRNMRYPPGNANLLWSTTSAATVTIVGMIAKVFLWMTDVRVEGLDRFVELVMDEKRTRAILTGKTV